jgi:hypothetical protein
VVSGRGVFSSAIFMCDVVLRKIAFAFFLNKYRSCMKCKSAGKCQRKFWTEFHCSESC